MLAQGISSEDDGDNTVSFLISGSIVVTAASRKLIEAICFIKVMEAECISENAELDDYVPSIPVWVAYMKRSFLKKVTDSANGQILSVMNIYDSLYFILPNFELLIFIFLVLLCSYFAVVLCCINT